MKSTIMNKTLSKKDYNTHWRKESSTNDNKLDSCMEKNEQDAHLSPCLKLKLLVDREHQCKTWQPESDTRESGNALDLIGTGKDFMTKTLTAQGWKILINK